jgi:hypothetical protein
MCQVANTGLHYDVEMKEIAAITPRPDFLPVLRLLQGVIEYEEATGTLVTGRWQQRNRRVSNALSPILYLFQLPTSTLSRKLQIVLSEIETPLVTPTQRRPGPKNIPSGIPKDQWSTVMHRVLEKQESLRTVAHAYGVSHETIRRIMLQVQKQSTQQ